MKKWLLCISVLIYLVSSISHAQTLCYTGQLTTGATYNAPQIDGEWLVWSGYERDGEQRFSLPVMLANVYKPDEVSRLTQTLSAETLPQISHNLLVWLNSAGSEREVLLYNTDTQHTQQLPTPDMWVMQPRIHNGQIVWAAVATPNDNVLNMGEIYHHDYQTGITTRITANDEGDYDPQIHNGRIVWISTRQGQPTVSLYQDGTITIISANADTQSNPQLNDHWIVWTKSNEKRRADLYVYDLETRSETLISDTSIAPPALDDDSIVWAAYAGSDTDIFLYDGQIVQQISHHNEDDFSPYVADNLIVWSGITDGHSNIFQYDISTAATTQLTTSDYNAAPQTAQGRAVWLGNNDVHGGDVFLYGCG